MNRKRIIMAIITITIIILGAYFLAQFVFRIGKIQLNISSAPNGASIVINGQAATNNIYVQPGKYLVSVIKDGYYEYRKTYNVDSQNNKISLTLKSKPDKINSITITNSDILYKYIGSNNSIDVLSMLKKSVTYNISISNDPAISSDYAQLDNFNANTAKVYKKNVVYTVKIDNKITSINNTPWNYRFTFTVNDGRSFNIDINANPDNSKSLISIKKTN